MGTEEVLSVWVVTAVWKVDQEPIVALWNNDKAAEANYEYLVRVLGEDRVHLDCLPVMSTFKVGN